MHKRKNIEGRLIENVLEFMPSQSKNRRSLWPKTRMEFVDVSILVICALNKVEWLADGNLFDPASPSMFMQLNGSRGESTFLSLLLISRGAMKTNAGIEYFSTCELENDPPIRPSLSFNLTVNWFFIISLKY